MASAARGAVPGAGARPPAGWTGWGPLAPVLLVAFALACSLSPLWFGFYDLSQWGILALVLLGVMLAAALAAPLRPSPALALALGGLFGLAVLSYVSTTWAESSSRALVESGRWILYAAALGALVLLLRGRRDAVLLIAATTAGVLAVVAYEVIRMVDGHGLGLFLGGRLNEPLGYVNGQAGFLLLGFWPLVASAERRHLLYAPLAVMGATLVTCMLVLTQARGVVLAALVSIPVMLAAVPGRPARLWTLATIGAATVAGSGPLLHVYRSASTLTADDVRRAALTALVASLLAGVVWGAGNALISMWEGSDGRSRRAAARTARWASIALLVVAVGVVGVAGPRLVRDIRNQYHSFVHLDTSYGGSRFLSGAGSRYDYWRIALNEFKAHPVLGEGAGNYDRLYFIQRRTPEDVRQPHSLELQVLSELGLVGAILLALFLVGVLWGLAGASRRGRADPRERWVAVAAAGTFLAWLAHTSVDWLHLLPGVTGVALACAAALVAPYAHPLTAAAVPRPRWRTGLAAGAITALVLLGALTVARPLLAQHRRAVAANTVSHNPVAAIRDANSALRLVDDVETDYVKAAAYARLNDFADAYGTLMTARRLEPHNFVTWGLLGDLLARRGSIRAAQAAYLRASALNPLDADLKNLATSRAAVDAVARSR